MFLPEFSIKGKITEADFEVKELINQFFFFMTDIFLLRLLILLLEVHLEM